MRIFLDENLSEFVAEALNLLSKSYFQNIEVVSTKHVAELGLGAPDEKIIPFVGKEMGVLITRDRGISRTQVHYQLCQENNTIVVFIKLPKHSDRLWDLVRILVKHWEEIIKIATSNKPYSMRLLPTHGIEPL